MLPQEILDAIVALVDDRKTLKSCSLTGRSLRPASRQALFADVYVSNDRANLEKMLQCYSSTDAAKHARRLFVSCRNYTSSPHPQLLDLVSMLATGKHESVGLGDTLWQLPMASLIHTLTLDFIPFTRGDLLRVIWALPQLAHLMYNAGPLWEKDELRDNGRSEDYEPWKKSAPPRLRSLYFFGIVPVASVMEAIFPPQISVDLRLFSCTRVGPNSDLVVSIVKRARELEELDVWDGSITLYPGRVSLAVFQEASLTLSLLDSASQVIDLGSNPRLRRLSFSVLEFDGTRAPNHVLSCLRTVQADSLELICFKQPHFRATAGLDEFFKAMDDLLNNDPLFRRLRSVRFFNPDLLEASQSMDFAVELRKWLPQLCQRRIVSLWRLAEGRQLSIYELMHRDPDACSGIDTSASILADV